MLRLKASDPIPSIAIFMPHGNGGCLRRRQRLVSLFTAAHTRLLSFGAVSLRTVLACGRFRETSTEMRSALSLRRRRSTATSYCTCLSVCHRIAAAEALVSLVRNGTGQHAAAGSLDTSEARRVETDSSETGQRAAGRQHSPARVGGKVSAADGHTCSAYSDRAELAGSCAPFTAVLSPRLYSTDIPLVAPLRCAQSKLLTSAAADR
jgi:hypothetical protein